MFAPLRGQLRRGILFTSFAAEEIGLLGSAEWVKQPTRPLDKAIAMINMDMIGRIRDDTVYVGGVGTSPTFQPLLDELSKDSGIRFQYSQSGYAASDHSSFVAKNIPVLFFFSGLHSDYHKPSDTWEKINAESAARLLNLITAVLLRLDSSPAAPQFVTTAAEEENPHAGIVATGGGGGGYGPYFGSIPDFAPSDTCVRFSDLQPNSPAVKAGLKPGDVLIDFGGSPIRNLYDFTDALQRSRVGDAVQVTVLRDGMPVKVTVVLEQRR
jgi:hypothetical protein